MKWNSAKTKLSIVILMGFVLWGIVVINYYIISSRVNDELLDKEAALIEHELFLLFSEITQKSYGLEYLILASDENDYQDALNSYVLTLIDLDEGLTNVSYAPLGIIEYSYPYNETIIGRNLYLDLDVEVKDDVLVAEEYDVITVSGSLDAESHFCNGFAFRDPIYNDETFIGFINICISYEYIEEYFLSIESDIFSFSLFNQYFESVFGNAEYNDEFYYYDNASLDIQDWYLGLEVLEEHTNTITRTRVSFIFLSLSVYSLILISGLYYYNRSLKLFAEKEKLIYYDKLTSLPNRHKLEDTVSTLIKKGNTFFLIFVDLDNFKYLNDTYGHTNGDLMLTEIARIFNISISNKISFYRWGGDEFVILYKSSLREDVILLIDEINSNFATPIKLNNIQYNLFLSMGISSYPENGNTIDELIRCGDIAMYKVKEFHNIKHLFFEKFHMLEFLEENKIEESINQTSLEEYQVYLQPIVNLKTGKVQGYESLLRVFDSNGYILNTQKVIDFAEKNGTVSKIDMYVFDKVCDYINELKDNFDAIVVGVNLSVQSLNMENIDLIKKKIAEKNVPSNNIVIEITETSKIIDFDIIIDVLNRLKELGFYIALDDFGSGYSSLNYLAQLPVTHIKIDKEFITNYKKPVNMQLLKSIKSISTSLNLKTVAEGIEESDQLEMIKKLGFDYYQGYHYSKPKPYKEILKRVKEMKHNSVKKD